MIAKSTKEVQMMVRDCPRCYAEVELSSMLHATKERDATWITRCTDCGAWHKWTLRIEGMEPGGEQV